MGRISFKGKRFGKTIFLTKKTNVGSSSKKIILTTTNAKFFITHYILIFDQTK